MNWSQCLTLCTTSSFLNESYTTTLKPPAYYCPGPGQLWPIGHWPLHGLHRSCGIIISRWIGTSELFSQHSPKILESQLGDFKAKSTSRTSSCSSFSCWKVFYSVYYPALRVHCVYEILWPWSGDTICSNIEIGGSCQNYSHMIARIQESPGEHYPEYHTTSMSSPSSCRSSCCTYTAIHMM